MAGSRPVQSSKSIRRLSHFLEVQSQFSYNDCRIPMVKPFSLASEYFEKFIMQIFIQH